MMCVFPVSGASGICPFPHLAFFPLGPGPSGPRCLKGATSLKNMPGGGPQGTILGMFLFIILINPIEFGPTENLGQIITSRNFTKMKSSHFKYIDDLTLTEKITLKSDLEKQTDVMELPATYHQRTGHRLKANHCSTQNKVNQIAEFADKNEMMINTSKCNVMLFNRSRKYDFYPSIKINQNEEIPVTESLKLLGVTISSNLKWHDHINHLSKRANCKLWLLRRLKKL